MTDSIETNQYETDDKAEKYLIFKKNLFFSKVDVPSIKSIFNYDLSGKSIIDYACGLGNSTWILASMNPDKIVGVDLSPQMIEKAKQLSSTDPKNRKIEFFVRNCSEKVGLGEFDYVFSSHLLKNSRTIETLEKFASSMFNSLKPGGSCVGLFLNPFLQPHNFNKSLKYGFEIQFKGNFNVTKFYDGDARNGKFLFEITTSFWNAEVYEECFKKVGFLNFEWINPKLDEEYEDKDGFFDDFFICPFFILFRALKPETS